MYFIRLRIIITKIQKQVKIIFRKLCACFSLEQVHNFEKGILRSRKELINALGLQNLPKWLCKICLAESASLRHVFVV